MGRKSKAKQERRKKREQAKRAAALKAAKRAEERDAAEPETIQPVAGKRVAVEPEIMPPLDEDDDFDQELQRLLNVLGVSGEDDADVTDETLETYFHYLREHISLPFMVTGIEDMGCFGWEEYYTWGPGSKREHQRLKKSRPSYTDTYELLGFYEDELYEDEGILVHVKRTTDKKKFTLPLADLEGTDEHSKNTHLLHDYVSWFVNYR